MNDYILEMKDINKSFFGVQVLNNASLYVKPGEVHVLLGENGAGKSTLIKILSGAYRREQGDIFLEGEPFIIHTPKEAIDKGISVIYQEFNLVPGMSIYENIYLGKQFIKAGLVDHKKAIQESRKYMDQIGLDVNPNTLVSTLSVAKKQMVEILKAISSDVKVLVLDEPTASITEQETEMLFGIIRKLKKKGIGIIYISHRLQELFEIGDRCTVMRDGNTIKTVDMKETSTQELIRYMVGREVVFSKVPNPYIHAESIQLSVEKMYYKELLKDICFDLRKGEILGISGLVGSGRTELAKCIIGQYKPQSGTIKVRGKTIRNNSVTRSIKNGIVYLSEDRKDEGLIVKHSVIQNVELPNLDQFGKLILDDKKIIKAVKSLIEKLRIKTTGYKQEAVRLSGGNQQKVVIAKWLLNDANVYIFDEPTRGIDVGSREEIYNIMRDLVKKGCSIIMISSDMVEILKLSDRILIMCEGKISAILDNEDGLSQENILYHAVSGGK